jgi:RNA polymerase sigma-70 factor (ECF subfamily)
MHPRSSLQLEPQGEALSVPQLVRQYHASLLRFLRRRLGSDADPADVAQETYVRMLRYEGSREIRSPYALLLRIAHHVCQDMTRSDRVRRTDQHRDLDELELASPLACPDRQIAASEELERVLMAIEELPPRRRQVFLLHREHHLSYAEIAERCGISVKMVEKHISSALTYCLARIES